MTLGPAVIGSAGVQIALFADTIIGSMLPTGGVSSIYYADRIYQLPLGVIGIAAGTVLLPEMSRLFAAGNPGGALHAQNRTMALSLALSAPFFIAFIMIPDAIMRGVFLRGAFTAQAASASAAVLTAYGFGLVAIVLLRSAVASFQAQGDTKTPMLIALGAVAINVALKIVLFKPIGRGRACRRDGGRSLDQSCRLVLFRDPARCHEDRPVFVEDSDSGDHGVLRSLGFRSLCRRARPAFDGGPWPFRLCV